MNMVKKLLCAVLALVIVCSCCACGRNGSSDTDGGVEDVEKTTEDVVRSLVETRGMTAYFGMKIGGNELKSSRVTITNVKKISSTEYNVSGKIVMTDVYGTQWNNTFDCSVKQRNDDWSAGSLEYTNDKWTKG